MGHRFVEGPRPEISAISIDNPFSKHAVVVIWSVTDSGQSYGFSAGDNVLHATERALVELNRTQSLLANIVEADAKEGGGKDGDVFERRIRFFSKPQGAGLFQSRLDTKVATTSLSSKLLFDGPVIGPWDAYAGVWRTIIEAPNKKYLSDQEDYFFW